MSREAHKKLHLTGFSRLEAVRPPRDAVCPGKIRNKLYISGGFQVASYPIAYPFLYAYDYAADRLVRKADMPKATTDGVSGVIQDKLYALGAERTGSPPTPPRSTPRSLLRGPRHEEARAEQRRPALLVAPSGAVISRPPPPR